MDERGINRGDEIVQPPVINGEGSAMPSINRGKDSNMGSFGTRRQVVIAFPPDYALDQDTFNKKYHISPNTTLSPDLFMAGTSSVGYDRSEESGVQEYVAAMKQFPLLNKELERIIFTHKDAGHSLQELKEDPEFWKAFEKTDPVKVKFLLDSSKTLQDTVWLTNVRLAVAVAHKFRGKMPMSEMIQEGSIALAHAFEKFEVERGFKFSTYAIPWIRQGIMRALQDKSRTVRLPAHLNESLIVIRKIAEQYWIKNGKNIKFHELIAIGIQNGLSDGSIESVVQASIRGTIRDSMSLDVPVGEGKEATYGDFIVHTFQKEESTSEAAERIDSLQIIKDRIFAAIPDRRIRYIVLERLEFLGHRHKSLEDLGRELHVTRERIRQLEAKGFKVLRRDELLKKILYPPDTVAEDGEIIG